MLRTNTVFCCHRNEIIARLKEDFGYETRLPLTGPIYASSSTFISEVAASNANSTAYPVLTPDE